MKKSTWWLMGLALVAIVVVVCLAIAGVFRSPEEIATIPPVIVAIDAGHGGADPGAVFGEIYEKDINAAIVAHIEALIEADPELDAILTRWLDIAVANVDRVAMAEEGNASLYVSIHVNAFSDASVYGMEVWVDDTRTPDDPSWALARAIQEHLVAETAVRDRGVRSQESYLHRLTVPSVSVEVGYLTNAEERALLLDDTYQRQVATGILNGIRAFLVADGQLSESAQENPF
ncbi:N-acetylmuramoyl-L-alanine amidase [Candidatus Bipolaricaulota bacterium]|nr:N-acetylmuramoyl-L-alanine amidase [Candidatus Bipolaricaulota bacterium]